MIKKLKDWFLTKTVFNSSLEALELDALRLRESGYKVRQPIKANYRGFYIKLVKS